MYHFFIFVIILNFRAHMHFNDQQNQL